MFAIVQPDGVNLPDAGDRRSQPRRARRQRQRFGIDHADSGEAFRRNLRGEKIRNDAGEVANAVLGVENSWLFLARRPVSQQFHGESSLCEKWRRRGSIERVLGANARWRHGKRALCRVGREWCFDSTNCYDNVIVFEQRPQGNAAHPAHSADWSLKNPRRGSDRSNWLQPQFFRGPCAGKHRFHRRDTRGPKHHELTPDVSRKSAHVSRLGEI